MLIIDNEYLWLLTLLIQFMQGTCIMHCSMPIGLTEIECAIQLNKLFIPVRIM